jgi:hypothetical protein
MPERAALVTGASSRIGFAIARTLSEEGYIRPEDISETVRYLLKTSASRVVPEIVFQRPGEAL